MQRQKKHHDDQAAMTKRRSEDDEPGPIMSAKIKTEPSAVDYSEDVKRKLSTASRTSTACDRCRVRKMRCDDQPEGCNPCRQNQTECKTTDRITGKATVRGYVESLERKIHDREAYIRHLQARIVALGGDTNSEEDAGELRDPSSSPWSSGEAGRGGEVSSASPGRAPTLRADGTVESGLGLPKFRSGLTGNNYLGVSTGDSLLSSIRGTSMNVLGMEVDIADYSSPDLDEPDLSGKVGPPLYNKSYSAFIQTAFGANPKLSTVELPPRKEGIEQGHLFCRHINPFLPILHCPSFLNTLTRFYDDPNFEPTIAETVMVHAVFAIMHSQFASRAYTNDAHKNELNQSSNFHYHYALGFFPKLMASHTLADVQALTLLGMHVRNLPKPGACWMLISTTLNLAIELGLHRSAKRWAATSRVPSRLEIEVRKRVFWAIVVLHVTVSGNLGRPLALRSEDWDVEMPEAVDDDLLTEKGLDRSKPGRCNFLVGLEGLRLMPIMTDLYNSIYTVKRSPRTYVDTIRGLERRIKEWREHWPQAVLDSSADENDPGHVHAQWLECAPLHLRLLLRHPSLSLTSDASFNAENITVCLECCRKLLQCVKKLQRYRSLDGTWQAGALYMLAIATTLFANWERRDQVTSNSLALLKEEMGSWLSIMGDVGQLLGSGRMLQDAVQISIEKTLATLAAHLAAKEPPPAPPPVPSLPRAAPSRSSTASVPNSATSAFPQPGYYPFPADQTTSTGNDGQMPEQASNFMPPAGMGNQTTTLAYHDPRSFAYQTDYSTSPTTYDQPRPFPQPESIPTTQSAATAHAYMTNFPQTSNPNPNASNFPMAAQPAFPTSPHYHHHQQHPAGTPSSWRSFTGNITSSLDPNAADFMSSASALMQLGRSDGTGNPSQQDIQLSLEMQRDASGVNGTGDLVGTWPFGTYE